MLRARFLQPTNLALNASSCHHSVTRGQSLLSKPQFPHLSNGVDHLISPGNLEQRSRVGFEGSKGNLEPWKVPSRGLAHSRSFMHLYSGPCFPFLLDLGTP